MSSLSDKTGGPAFPHDKYMKNGDQWGTYAHGGMSLRDYFAARASQAMLGRDDASLSSLDDLPNLLSFIAKVSYLAADAMIAARQEPQS